jgi:hypothetical protein
VHAALKNGKRRQVPHRKRASFGGSALPPRIAIMVELVCATMPVGLDDRPGTSLECVG